jgi:hypothetical protein
MAPGFGLAEDRHKRVCQQLEDAPSSANMRWRFQFFSVAHSSKPSSDLLLNADEDFVKQRMRDFEYFFERGLVTETCESDATL